MCHPWRCCRMRRCRWWLIWEVCGSCAQSAARLSPTARCATWRPPQAWCRLTSAAIRTSPTKGSSHLRPSPVRKPITLQQRTWLSCWGFLHHMLQQYGVPRDLRPGGGRKTSGRAAASRLTLPSVSAASVWHSARLLVEAREWQCAHRWGGAGSRSGAGESGVPDASDQCRGGGAGGSAGAAPHHSV